ncbi:MAG: hypothetical protein UT33_C0011G0037 [Candidatus Peregrinibacteria bacterium GW2011_GWC2_39_14]|nr:MAG: hypothetical protein UT33_C0011G0037 [Candidatus Peregrinibacteria bacterium GW2011_GWC2_39_14]
MEIKKSFLVPLAFAAIVGLDGCDRNLSYVSAVCKCVADAVYMCAIESFGGIENPDTVEKAQAKSMAAQSKCLVDKGVDPEF